MYGEALSNTNELYSRDGIDLLARLIYCEFPYKSRVMPT